jgi:ribonuclease HII
MERWNRARGPRGSEALRQSRPDYEDPHAMKMSEIDWWSEERAARKRGFAVVGGIDEAGRGPLAGPVVGACVVLPFETSLPHVRDSKMLTALQREKAYTLIEECARGIGIGISEVADIDAINILRASHQAMRMAVAGLDAPPDVALIDGLAVQPFPIPQIAIVQGDGRSASIAAASIIAKVTRDRLMAHYDAQFPGYGFAAHKGYATPEHIERLRELGPSPIHRRSFAPIAELLCQPTLALTDGRHETGMSGEAAAAAHLAQLGWDILATRYHCQGGEIDIIARDGETVVFVEVKTRRSRAASPAESIGSRKRARIVTAATNYLYEQSWHDCDARFDVAEVLAARGGLLFVNLLRGAFMAGE